MYSTVLFIWDVKDIAKFLCRMRTDDRENGHAKSFQEFIAREHPADLFLYLCNEKQRKTKKELYSERLNVYANKRWQQLATRFRFPKKFKTYFTNQKLIEEEYKCDADNVMNE